MTKIIAEIGINHNGNFFISKKLIDAAARSGVNAVKFQYRNLSRVYYKKKNEIGDEILSFEIKKNFLSANKIIKLANYAKSLNLEAGISFFTKDDINDFKNNIKIFDFFKIPSVEMKNLILVKSLLKLKKHVYISTGAHSEIEIEKTFQQLKAYKNWYPFHCISNYPTALFNSNLGYIDYLKKKWKRDVGFSSHESNYLVCVAAISKGIKWIERHITLDKLSKGLDHSSSSTEDELKKIIEYCRYKEMIFSGNSKRLCNQGELINKQNLGRSYYFKKDLSSGQKVTPNDILYRMPFAGYGAGEKKFFINKKLVKDAKNGSVITKYHFYRKSGILNWNIKKFDKYKISLPVRFHDYEEISKIFPIKNFELHLSYTELLSSFSNVNFSRNHQYTIHIPDYISSTQLINPFSNDKRIKDKSLMIIHNSCKLAKFLFNMIGKKIIIVSSISNIENISKIKFYKQCKKLQNKFNSNEYLLTFQILPPYAWYFGGSYLINSFSKLEDLRLIVSLNLKITLDLSHLIMSSNYYNFNIFNSIKLLKPITENIHLSFASRFDSEGEGFECLNKKNKLILKSILRMPQSKVLEVWQGHLNNYDGFFASFNALDKYLK